MSRSKYRKWGETGGGWDKPSHPRAVLETSWSPPFRLKRYPRENVPSDISLTLKGTFSVGRGVGGGGSGPTSRSYTGRYYWLEIGLLGARAKLRVHHPVWEETRAEWLTNTARYHRKCDLIHQVAREQGCPHEDKLQFPMRNNHLPNQLWQVKGGEVTTYQPAGATSCSLLDCRKTIYFTPEQMDFILPPKPDPDVESAIASIKEGSNA